MKEPGLDGRHRDKSGRIDTKHGNTLIGTIERKYNVELPFRADMKLENALKKAAVPSLTQLLKKYR